MHMLSPVKITKKKNIKNMKHNVVHLMNNHLFEGENVKLIINWQNMKF